MRRALILVAAAALACGREGARTAARDSTRGVSARPGVARDTGTGTAAHPKCPATGQWSECAIVERLDRAGLAPQVDSTAHPRTPPLSATGFLVRMSRGDAEVYLYADERSRKRDEEKLDHSRYLEYTEAVSMQTLPTLIPSANALVILHSRNDHQRERVGDAVTAGPPSKQP